ncbi:MAG: hypothetical protein ABIJ45_12280 [Candidatus Zixiibacteriota bacterium]
MKSDSLGLSLLFFREFMRFIPLDHYILINEGGLHYFQMTKSDQELILSVPYSRDLEFKKLLSEFIRQLKDCGRYLGQPLKLLIGSPYSFTLIKLKTKKASNDLSKQFNFLNLETTQLSFKHITLGDKKYIYFGGIKSDIYHEILQNFQENGIEIEICQPMTLFLLENSILPNNYKNVRYDLPGETIQFYNQDGQVAFINVTDSNLVTNINESQTIDGVPIYTLTSDIKTVEDNKPKPFYIAIVKPIFELKRKASFFKLSNQGLLTKIISPLAGSFKYAAILTILLVLFFVPFMVTLAIWQDSYSKLLSAHEYDSGQKIMLEKEIANLSSRIQERRQVGEIKTYFAGAISALCQKRPSGLLLQEISVAGNADNGWSLTALGISDNENDVFKYKDYISQYAKDFSTEVTFIEKGRQNSYGRQPSEKANFYFKLKIGLDNNAD